MTGSAGPSNVMPSTTKKRTRRSLNCEPCRLHKLKCNRARPCSGCVQRGTQNMCFPNYAAEPRKRKASGSSSSQHGSLRGVSSSSAAPLDPLAELNAIQSSLSTLQRHYRTMKKHAHDNVSAPDSALYQDALLGSDTLEAFFIGPTHSCTNLYNYFDSFPASSPLLSGPSSFTVPDLKKTVLSKDLIPLLPPKQALQTLITEYLSSATWIHRYVDEVELNYKLERYLDADELSELTLALFFALSATTLHYIQWDHKIWRNWPEDSNVTASRFHDFARMIIDRSHEILMSHPSIALLEVYLVLGHYHTTVKLGDSGERMWALSHKMIELAMTLGLHRDPDERGLPEHEVAKRRWVWWNILSFERWTCILLGRPMTISNTHFDTRFPILEPTQPAAQEAAENGYLPYLTIFRYTLLLGRILDDLNNVVHPISPERAAIHDADLHKWRESWPPDMELTEYTIATSLARTQEESRQRRGIQSLHLIGTFHYTRFILHQSLRLSGTREILANSASALIALVNRCVHYIMLNPKLRVSGQLGIGPYFILLPGIFYTHQLLDNPDQAGATNFRANLVDAYNIAHLSEPLPISIRIAKLLASTSFIAPLPPRGRNVAAALAAAIEEGKTNEDIARERIKVLKRITFPYAGLQPEVHGCDVEDVFTVSPSADGDASTSCCGGTTRIGTNSRENTILTVSVASVIGTRVSTSELGENEQGSPRLPPDLAHGVRLFRDTSLT